VARSLKRRQAIAGAARLAGLKVRADCGQTDRFPDATRALAAKGCHDGMFWRQAPAQLRFLAAALAAE
jgi:hypothetical protein